MSGFEFASDWMKKFLSQSCSVVDARPITFFTITTEIHGRSLANFYSPYADRHMNLKFM